MVNFLTTVLLIGQGCARLWRGQSRLSTLASRESLSARSLKECEELCRSSQAYTCRSFSFTSQSSGYLSYSSRNCDLSDIGDTNLRSGDMDTDYNSDVFIMTQGACSGGQSSATGFIRE